MWVKRAWVNIPNDMVSKFFLKCGISNNMDGRDDDKLYSDLMVQCSNDC